MMQRARVWLCAVLLLGFALPRHAHASPVLELLGGGIDAGATARVGARNPTAAYFNPALLPSIQPGASASVMLLIERIDVQLKPRSESALCDDRACDVPEVNGTGPEAFRHEDERPITSPTLPTRWLERGRRDADGAITFAARPRGAAASGESENAYLSAGFVSALIEEHLAFGFHLLLPLQDALQTQAFYADEREQFFSNSLHPELYGDRLHMFGIAAGVGLRITPIVSLGVSASLGIAGNAQAPVYVSNLADLDAVLVDAEVSVGMSLSPHFGVLVTPLPGLRLAATAHSPQGAEVETGFSYVIATGIEQHASQTFTHGYLPWTFGLGAELALGRIGTHAFGVAATGTYGLWSSYRDRHHERPRGDYAWADTPAASVALQHVLAWGAPSELHSTLDLSFQPSPVPAQTGRTSYVDNDRIAVGLGSRYGFALFGQAAHVGLHAQLHRLLPRSVTKDPSQIRDEVPDDAIGGTPRGPIEGRDGLQTNSPGFPGFSSEGVIFAAGAELGLEF